MGPPATRFLLILVLLLAAVLRLPALSTYGFSDDEIAKVNAIDSYRRGDFTANAEHPMLMKLVMWGALSAADRWNGRVGPGWQVAPEAALRLPNAVAGVATVAIVYGVTSTLFGSTVGITAAALIALDPNITATNRIGKEDTLLMLFFLIAVFCYERAKLLEPDYARAHRWYMLCGGSFGLMLASKYLPHMYGLYALYNASTINDRPDSGPQRSQMHAVMAATFVAANLAILSPRTWAYIANYVRGGTLTHHGQMYGNRLYVTDVPVSFAGVPFTYYFNMIGTKVPLIVLAAALVGCVPLVLRRRERGFVWLRVFLVFLLLGYSMMAAKFQRYGLPMLLFLDIVAAVGLVTVATWIARRAWAPAAKASLTAIVYAVPVVMLVADCWQVAPFYSVHQNAIGARLAAPATRFPEEAYDYGVREAVADISRTAAPGAVIVSDTPGIVTYYLQRSGRPDLRARSLSMEGLAPKGEQYVLVQDDHIYFENVSAVEQLRRARTPWRDYRVMRTPVLQVFRLAL